MRTTLEQLAEVFKSVVDRDKENYVYDTVKCRTIFNLANDVENYKNIVEAIGKIEPYPYPKEKTEETVRGHVKARAEELLLDRINTIITDNGGKR